MILNLYVNEVENLLYAIIGGAGAIGALLRYTFGMFIPSTYFMGFPLHTLVINLSGSFALSCFFTWISKYGIFPSWARTAIATGFIGSFTTFSTFNIELIQLVKENQLFYAGLYFICSAAGGYFFSWLGYEWTKNKGEVT
jgi:CrcB protein